MAAELALRGPGGERGSRQAPVEAAAAGPPLPPGLAPCGGARAMRSGVSAGVASLRSWTVTRMVAWMSTSCARDWPGWERVTRTVAPNRYPLWDPLLARRAGAHSEPGNPSP